jgi:hypothetical protein
MAALTTLEMQRRIIGFYRGPNAMALVGVNADRVVADVALYYAIADSWGFDDAEGDQLDTLGSILQLPREGVTDERYRVLLQMQAQVLLSSVGSTPVLEAIAEIWCGVPPVQYDEPVTGLGAELVMEVTVPDLDDYSQLLVFLRKAKLGGVRLNVHVGDENVLINDYTPALPAANAGITDYTPALPRAGASTLAYGYTL